MFFLALFIVLGVSNTALAENELLFGQNHYYNVVFRGNGEAITYAKLVINNPNKTPLTEFSFEVPKVDPTEMTIYQMTLPKVCAEYDHTTTKENPPCLKYDEPDYTSSYYYGYYRTTEKPEYQSIDFTNTGNTYKFTLPQQIEPYKSSAIIVSYAAKGYTKKSFGLQKFNFETIKVSSRIQELKVAIEVDSDLFLKNKDSEVNYSSSDSNLGVAKTASSISSKALDEVVGNIGSYGQINKTAKSLSPNESLTIKGEYAENWFRLYLTEILIIILVIIIIFVGLILITRFLKKRDKKNNQTTDKATESKKNISSSLQKNLAKLSILKIAIVGFISAVLTTLIGVIFIVIEDSNIFYTLISRADSSIYALANLLFVILGILLFFFTVFGPAIFFGIKYGWKSSLYILLSEFLWFMLLLVIIIIFSQAGTTVYPYHSGIEPLDATNSAL
jgi:hypothetical protein